MNFKKKASQHQIDFFYGKRIYYGDDNPRGAAKDYWLNEKDAMEGKNFYSDYEIFEEVKNKASTTPDWLLNTLDKKNIAYNFFIPFKTEGMLATKVLNHLYHLDIKTIQDIRIDFPSISKNPLHYPNSLDVFVAYQTNDDKKKFVCFEIKYTEGGFIGFRKNKPATKVHRDDFTDKFLDAALFENTSFSRLKEYAYIRIWQDHLLAVEWMKQENYDNFLFVALYPEGNSDVANIMKEYDSFLTPYGKQTLTTTTYENLFATLDKFADSERQRAWINYLKTRYIVK